VAVNVYFLSVPHNIKQSYCMASEDFECSAYIVKYRCIILFLRYFDGAGSSNFYYYNFYYL